MSKAATALLLVFALLLAACGSVEREIEPVTIDRVELESFADRFFPAHMERLHIPGVSFVLVQDGAVVLAKGYGVASLEEESPILADSTVMRIGSVSKSFVATAVMQLVEQHQLDLNADVNQYLTTFQLEDTFRQPVTLAGLLTHTAGFEDPLYESTTDPAQVPPLGIYLAESMPPRTHPPGKTFVYSNHGYALAAYVVEEVSGLPFDDYVTQNILEPLGMTHSGYLIQPPLPQNLAVGYFYEGGTQVPQPVDFDGTYPGGSVVATATDVAKFMIAHLDEGCYEGACILQPSTIAEMHRKQADTPFAGQAAAYGFVEATQGGQRLLGHSGAIRGFGTSLNLLPEHNLGYFFSFNEECYETTACQIISEFRTQFLERFF
ncbi:MAG: serine hydrolase domain-containing protein [Anaerolineae bacterium]